MGRDHDARGKRDSGRDSGGFVALPWAVLDCSAYVGLSHPARALLLELARQFVRDNNGRLLTSRSYLRSRGWKSASIIHRATQELIAAGFIHQTVKGHRPNKASWFALTWRSLDRHSGYDPGASATFERGAYKAADPIAFARREPPKRSPKNAVLSPSAGLKRASIGLVERLETPPPGPSNGPIRGAFDALPSPSVGHHLENPSAVQRVRAGDCRRPGATTRRVA